MLSNKIEELFVNTLGEHIMNLGTPQGRHGNMLPKTHYPHPPSPKEKEKTFFRS
jgi:hypothetical protein